MKNFSFKFKGDKKTTTLFPDRKLVVDNGTTYNLMPSEDM
jgi:hypothetical protein